MSMKYLSIGQLIPLLRHHYGKYVSVACLSFFSLFVARYAHAQTFEWVKGIGGVEADYGYSVAVDNNGDVYVTGSFLGVVDFNPGSSTGQVVSFGAEDIFLAKYDASGNMLWVKGMGGWGEDRGYNVAIDGGGNVYVTGKFSTTADFNPGGNGGTLPNNTGSEDIFLAKYDRSGNFLWAKNMGSSDQDRGFGLAIDRADNVYVVGYFGADADFNPGGNGGVLLNAGSMDAFLAKYDASGNFLWAKAMGGRGYDQSNAVAVDSGGNVYITGSFTDTVDFNPGGGGGMLISEGADDVFLAKYDSNGNYLWAKGIGGNLLEWSMGIGIDGSSNVYITGYTLSGVIDFNPGGSGGSLATVGLHDVFLAKYDAGGNYLWHRGIGGNSTEYSQGMAVDDADNVYVTGFFMSDTINFNSGSGIGASATLLGLGDVFLVKYDGSGSCLWSKAMGGHNTTTNASMAIGGGVAVDGRGNVYGTGEFTSDTIDFNPGGAGGALANKRISNVPSTDAFLVKFSCGDTSSSLITVSLPCGESYTLKDHTYNTTGIYTQTFSGLLGCDSTVTLDLTIVPIEHPVINVDGFTLGIARAYIYDSYQWMKDDVLIPGATDSTYTVKANGEYRVIVTKGEGCSDTSDIYLINNSGIAGAGSIADHIWVYPNPATDKITIQSPVKVNVTLTDVSGRMIKQVNNARQINIQGLASGIYLLKITDQEGRLIKVSKMVKQE